MALKEPEYTFNRTNGRITEFKGYNARGVREDGEMKDMKNLSSDEYPMMSQRKPRARYANTVYNEPIAMMRVTNAEKDDAVMVLAKNSTGHYVPMLNGSTIAGNSPSLSAKTKMVRINNKVCFFPQKTYYNLDTDEYGYLSANVSLTNGTCSIGGDPNLGLYSSTITLPSNVGNLMEKFKVGDAISIDIQTKRDLILRKIKTPDNYYSAGRFQIFFMKVALSNDGHVVSAKASDLYVYELSWDGSGTAAEYKKVADAVSWKYESLVSENGYQELIKDSGTRIVQQSSNLRYTYTNISSSNGTIRVYDYVADPSLSSEVASFEKADAAIAVGKDDATGVIPVSAVIQAIAANSITLNDNAFNDTQGAQIIDKQIDFTKVTINRDCPSLDFVVEWNNRLWGCNSKDNTIYASKLGDPTNWQFYQGTSLDSYAAEQGSDGRWTGIGKFSTHLIFFKEDCIHKVYGNYPAEYQIVTQVCSGCEEGSDKSIVTMEDGVLYKSRRGIMGYSGGIPSLISREFGNARYSEAIAGTDGHKYYVSMLDKSNKPHMFVYDAELEMWHKEDELRPTGFEWYDGKLCYIGVDDYINYIDADEGSESIEWMAEFGPLDEYVEEQKIYSVIKLRYKLSAGSSMKIEMSVDESDWEEVEVIETDVDQSDVVEVIPRRCDRFGIRVSGTGHCEIKTLTREFRQGSGAKENY